MRKTFLEKYFQVSMRTVTIVTHGLGFWLSQVTKELLFMALQSLTKGCQKSLYYEEVTQL